MALELLHIAATILVGTLIFVYLYYRAIRNYKAREDFFSAVSHELRTPLNSICLSVQNMQRMPANLDPAQASALNVANRNCRLIARLLTDLLDYAKARQGEALHLERIELDVGSVLDEVSRLMTPIAAQTNVRITAANHVPERTLLWADPDRLSQILINLVSNAIRYSPKDGVVTIEVDATGGYLHFAVTDQGEGIPPEKLKLIWNPWMQAKGHYAGVGLGLAVSKTLVEQHGGRVGCISEVGKGSIFYFDLPSRPSWTPVF